ncbi:MAG: methylmalonyl-CoA epimerase [Candidatus Fischerbacteria bacterium RBG_13_37_8]|uniref:Methylmalonyl-CoA epimerase n=1 Tax=Candidatus Fischerbacteria bacterium RBG_13_37_8 TaxID=1817863 RepID=A0A1F5VEZ2_9BACT|nr:MAG: methylmalonyl-CoA epimerase [Candidatus Fischerbacteria bacterium RBG_13_37_8]
MNITRIDHIAIAFEDARDIAILWEQVLGFQLESEEILEENGVKVYIIKLKAEVGNSPVIEMLEPLGENSPINNFLKKKGKGIHHICFETLDIESDMQELRSKNIKLLNETPRRGAHNTLIAFIEPSQMGGILIELKQASPKADNS